LYHAVELGEVGGSLLDRRSGVRRAEGVGQVRDGIAFGKQTEYCGLGEQRLAHTMADSRRRISMCSLILVL
jgi:hypothetical protein